MRSSSRISGTILCHPVSAPGVLTAGLSSDGNAQTQPWVLRGILPTFSLSIPWNCGWPIIESSYMMIHPTRMFLVLGIPSPTKFCLKIMASWSVEIMQCCKESWAALYLLICCPAYEVYLKLLGYSRFNGFKVCMHNLNTCTGSSSDAFKSVYLVR